MPLESVWVTCQKQQSTGPFRQLVLTQSLYIQGVMAKGRERSRTMAPSWEEEIRNWGDTG